MINIVVKVKITCPKRLQNKIFSGYASNIYRNLYIFFIYKAIILYLTNQNNIVIVVL